MKEANRVQCIILSVDTVTAKWAHWFRKLQIPGPDPEFLAGLPFDHARNIGCQIALERGCEYVFHYDSDVSPAPDTIHRLIAHKKPIISGMYCRRSPPHAVPVMMRNHQWVTNLPGPGQNPVIEVELVGAGCLLISCELLRQYVKQRCGRPGKPWFDWRSDLNGMVAPGDALSEDFSFCKGIREKLGIPVLVDTSVRCLHTGLAEADYGTFMPAGVGQPR